MRQQRHPVGRPGQQIHLIRRRKRRQTAAPEQRGRCQSAASKGRRGQRKTTGRQRQTHIYLAVRTSPWRIRNSQINRKQLTAGRRNELTRISLVPLRESRSATDTNPGVLLITTAAT